MLIPRVRHLQLRGLRHAQARAQHLSQLLLSNIQAVSVLSHTEKSSTSAFLPHASGPHTPWLLPHAWSRPVRRFAYPVLAHGGNQWLMGGWLTLAGGRRTREGR